MVVGLLFILGLVFGSFFNVLIWRIPLGQSVVSPRSHCPQCKTTLGFGELVPVLSYLLQKGSCSHCDAKISIQYPIIELITGVLFGLSAYFSQTVPELVVALLFSSFLLVGGVIDYHHKILPNKITLPGIVVGLIFSILGWTIPIVNSLTGFLLGGTILIIFALIFKGGMGMGDVKFLALIGTFLGPSHTFITLFIASLAGSIFGLSYLAITKKGRKTKIPFGPFLAIGGLIAFFLLYHT